jgi:hypothetical protein
MAAPDMQVNSATQSHLMHEQIADLMGQRLEYGLKKSR